MDWRRIAGLSLLVVGLAAAAVAAEKATLADAVLLSEHDLFRIIGKIEKFEKLQLVVTTNYGERFLLQLQAGTPIQRNKKRVPATELKAGRSVVVDVSGDTLYDDDLFVVNVALVPSPRSSRK